MTQAPQGNYNPPAHNWAAGHQPKSDATSWVLPMIIGAVIFAVGCGSGLIVGWFGGTTNNLMDFTFELTPLHPGVYTAEITVYMDDYNSEWTELLIEVHEKPEDSDNPADPDPSIDSPAKSEP